MRMLVVKQGTDLKALGSRLFPASAGASTGVALERVKALNPHVDFPRIAAGTVLLLPDAAGLSTEESRAIGDDAFDGLVQDVNRGLGSAAQRLRATVAKVAADRSAVNAVLKLAAVKRIVDSDSALKEQVAEAASQAAAEQKQADEAVKAVEGLQKQVQEELAALRKLIG